MPDATDDQPRTRAFQMALDALVPALAKSAKNQALYKDGHATGVSIAERALDLLLKTMGDRATLVLEVKAKSFVHEERELASSPETAGMASALHTLGVGQLLFTNRVTREGMDRFFKILLLKPDAKTSLTDLQKQVQAERIDGLQMTFILDFVVTGEREEEDQPPGRLSEEQVQAFLRARTLPDLLTLLLRQNEPLRGKAAEAVDSLLASVLERDAPLEDLEEGMPWDLYDPRLRARIAELAAAAREGTRERDALLSWASVHDRADRVALREHAAHETYQAAAWCLDRVHQRLERPANAHQPKFAVAAYGRLIGDLGRGGSLDALLAEFARWKAMSADAAWAPHWPALRAVIDGSVTGPALAQRVVERVATLAPAQPGFERVVELLLFLGEPVMPLLLEQLPRVQDKAHRAALCALLAVAARSLGAKALLAALKDPDYFVVLNVAGILTQLGADAHAAPLAALLKHAHPKVREASWRALAKSAAAPAMKGLFDYVAAGEPEETEKAVIAMSLAPRNGLAEGFIAAFRLTAHERTRVSLVVALGRCPGAATVPFLKEQVRRTWYEVMTGRRKDVSAAAKGALETLRKDGHA